jgi:hypothetical protein
MGIRVSGDDVFRQIIDRVACSVISGLPSLMALSA